MSDKRAKIIFTKESIPFILECFGKKISAVGFVIDKKTKELQLDVDGNAFKPEQIIAIHNVGWITNELQLQTVVDNYLESI